jgi:hypothetical protein
MANGYSRSPKLLKGAIVQFVQMPIVPIPNIIVFQYNPDTLSRSLTPYAPPEPNARVPGETPPSTTPADPTAQPFDPTETFTLSLALDASDALETPERHPVAFVSGVADRIAALEMLLYPVREGLLGNLLGSANVSIGGGGGAISASLRQTAQRPEVPVILFVWGPGRIVPVRLTSFSVEEQQWNQLLYPTRAKVSVGMKVITKDALDRPGNATSGKDFAKFCYDFTVAQKKLLALANIANTVESVLGMLPF